MSPSGDDLAAQAVGVLSIPFLGLGGAYWSITVLQRGVSQVPLTFAGVKLTASGGSPP